MQQDGLESTDGMGNSDNEIRPRIQQMAYCHMEYQTKTDHGCSRTLEPWEQRNSGRKARNETDFSRPTVWATLTMNSVPASDKWPAVTWNTKLKPTMDVLEPRRLGNGEIRVERNATRQTRVDMEDGLN